MSKRKLGVLLSTAPSQPNVGTVAELCKTAVSSGTDVYLYLIDEGVKNIRDQRFLDLATAGAKLFVCAYGCQQHGVDTQGLQSEVSLCGLVVLSNIINGCDRFLAFN
jgi:sulfur relay (sulfurtransferase) complex TusBCD TusD component (DsrE family)